jgi:hypothetical protein
MRPPSQSVNAAVPITLQDQPLVTFNAWHPCPLR